MTSGHAIGQARPCRIGAHRLLARLVCLRARGGKDGLDHRGERGAHLRALPIAQHRELRLALALVAARRRPVRSTLIRRPSIGALCRRRAVWTSASLSSRRCHAPRAAALAIRQQTNPHAPDHTRVLQESSDLCLVCSVG